VRRVISFILIGLFCALVAEAAVEKPSGPPVLIPPIQITRDSGGEVSRSMMVPRMAPATSSTTSTTERKQVTTTTTVKHTPTTTIPKPTQVTSTSGLPAGLICIRGRESTNNYRDNTGNGYYGAYQYLISTWNNYRGYYRADLAPASVQDERALSDYNKGPVSRHQHWPSSSRQCGV
jgi:hypothetical protein